MKKKTTILITLITILCLLASTTVMASAATVKISKKSTTINAGSSTTLKITGTTKKVSWTSSSKSVASVKAIGKYSAKVTAKKAGTTKITAKVGTKKYTCKVTVKYAVGSRQNPADPTKGVTIRTSSGTLYFKLNNTYEGSDAINKFKEYDPETWEFHAEYSLPDYPGYEIVGLEYDVAAKSGYDKYPLQGSSIISEYGLYNGACNTSISNFHELYFLNANENIGASGLSLYGGGKSKMYAFFLVPSGTTAFSNNIYTSTFKQYWIKYNI